jgi:UPF0042 nucleotide-binding protein
MSGAGRSLALKMLEDLGWEAVDNLPLPLVASVVQGARAVDRPLALGVDTRTRGFAIRPMLATLDALDAAGARPFLLFMECEDEVLARRFTETRRRHPLAQDRPVSDGIATERRELAAVRERADWVIDTTHLLPADLRGLLGGRFAARDAGLRVAVLSFAFKQGLPREADLVFDVRFLRNPYYDATLKLLDGRDPRVQAHVMADPDFEPFMQNLTRLLAPLLPRYAREGKAYLTIAVGCTGGQHRSVFVAERLGAWIAEQGLAVSVGHRARERAVAAS